MTITCFIYSSLPYIVHCVHCGVSITGAQILALGTQFNTPPHPQGSREEPDMSVDKTDMSLGFIIRLVLPSVFGKSQPSWLYLTLEIDYN